MTRFRGSVTKEEIHKMVEKLDKDNDHKINKKGLLFFKKRIYVRKKLNSLYFNLKKNLFLFCLFRIHSIAF